MEGLEKIISEFESSVVGGIGGAFTSDPENPQFFNMLYLPQTLIETNWLGKRNTFEFDPDYNLSGVKLIREHGPIDFGYLVKSLLKRFEVTRLIYDPRYIYRHYKDKIKEDGLGLYSLEMDNDLAISINSTRCRIKIELESKDGKLEQVRVFSVGKESNPLLIGRLIFNYDNPWHSITAPNTEESEQEEGAEEETITYGDDIANEWMNNQDK